MLATLCGAWKIAAISGAWRSTNHRAKKGTDPHQYQHSPDQDPVAATWRRESAKKNVAQIFWLRFFSVVLVWNTFKGDFLGRLKKCLLETLTSFCNLENSWILQGIFNSHSYAIPVHDCHHLSCYYLWHYFYLLSFKDANNSQLCLFNATNEYFTNMCIFLFNCLIHAFRCDSFGFIFH